MIVNPPRSEAEFSSRLRAISVHAADKNEDPDDRPPLLPSWVHLPRIPGWVIRRVALLCSILFLAATVRVGLSVLSSAFGWPSAHAATAEMYRKLARDAEADANVYRRIARTGKPGLTRSAGMVSDPVIAQSRIKPLEQQAMAFRGMALTEERLNQGFPAR